MPHPSEIYAKLLLTKKHGVPLWIPEPDDSLPVQYKAEGIRIGDVGILTSYGAFDFLFNICVDSDDAINSRGVPDIFETVPFASLEISTHPDFHRPGTDIASNLTTKRTQRVEGATDPTTNVPVGVGGGFHFTCTAEEGAIVVMPNGASRTELLNKRPFLLQAQKHGAEWYEYANFNRGRITADGSLYLVTGSDKADAWGLASVSNLSVGTVMSLELKIARTIAVGVSYAYQWEKDGPADVRTDPISQKTILTERSGTLLPDTTDMEPLRTGHRRARDTWQDPAVSNAPVANPDHTPETVNRLENQCIFLRGFRISMRKSFNPLKSKAKISITNDETTSDIFRGPFAALTSPLRIRANQRIGSSRISATTSAREEPPHNVEGGSSKSENTEDAVVESIQEVLQSHDPLTVLNDWILSQVVDAELAITHDDDFFDLLYEDEDSLPEDHEIIHRASQRFDGIVDSGVATLRSKESAHMTWYGLPTPFLGSVRAEKSAATSSTSTASSTTEDLFVYSSENNATCMESIMLCLDTQPPDHLYVDQLIREANSSLGNFYRRSYLPDLDATIEKLQNSLDASHNEDVRISILPSLSSARRTRFHETGDDEDIRAAISIGQDLVSLSVEDAMRRAQHFRILGEAMLSWRRQRPNDCEDAVHQAVDYLRRSVQLTDGMDTDDAIRSLLGYGWALHFADAPLDKPGEDSLRDRAWALEKALQMTPEGHHLRYFTLYSLARAHYLSLCLQTSDMSGIHTAFCMLEEAIQLLPQDHFERHTLLINLAHCCSVRFEAYGWTSDLDRSVTATKQAMLECPQHHVDRYVIRGNHYEALFHKYRAKSQLSELDASIEGLRGLLKDMHPDDPYCFHSSYFLGNALMEAYSQYGKSKYLDEAVDHYYITAIRDAPPNSLYYCYMGRARAYHSRFLAHGHRGDLDAALDLLKLAEDKCPNPPQRAKYLGYLGDVLITRFLSRGKAVKEGKQIKEAWKADIEDAILALRHCLAYSFDSSSFLAGYYHSILGNALFHRFIAFEDEIDLDGAIQEQEIATGMLPEKHAFSPIAYSRLGCAYMQRFEAKHVLKDIQASVSAFTSAVNLTSTGHSAQATYVSQLGKAIYLRSNVLHDMHDVPPMLDRLRSAANDSSSFTFGRFDAALTWSRIAHQLKQYEDSLEGYRLALDLMPQIACMGLTNGLSFQGLRSPPDMCQDAAACAIALGKLEDAVEILDCGRTIICNSSQELRTDLTNLRTTCPQLVEELQETSAALEFLAKTSGNSPAAGNAAENADLSKAVGKPTQMVEDHNRRTYRRLAERWQELLDKIRERAGFQTFLKPLKFSELREAGGEGVIVVINVSMYRCDSLLIMEGQPVHLVPLPALTLSDITQNADTLDAALKVPKDEAGENCLDSVLLKVLGWLWRALGAPTWNAIRAHLPDCNLPRIWWCPTGPLSRLPVHACGLYEETGVGMIDLAISSYTPTLSTLRRAKSTIDNPCCDAPFSVLAIGLEVIPYVKDSELPFTQEEMSVLRQLWDSKGIKSTFLEGPGATVDRVRESMAVYSWLHVATHGITCPDAPLDSHLLLHDGRLRLSAIAQVRLPYAQFAYLSACHCAKAIPSLPDEALNLSGGLLMAGFKGVLASVWAIADEDGPVVAEHFYKHLMRENKMPDAADAAGALRQAMLALRNTPSVRYWRWVPFVHLGA